MKCKWPMYRGPSLTDECGRTTRFYVNVMTSQDGLGPTIEVCGMHLTSALLPGRRYKVETKS